MRAALLFCLSPLVLADLTPCQVCCSNGGDCSKASHGSPGVCCGNNNGQSYCCPTYTTGAKCFACNLGYRCYVGTPSPNICANDGGVKGPVHPGQRTSSYRRHEGDEQVSSFITLVIVIASAAVIVASISACLRHSRTPLAMTTQQTVEMSVAKPVVPGQAMPAGMPCATAYPAGMQPGMACAYPAGQPGCYPGHYPQAGYSGGNVAMGAGMGFLGGMMVGEMMSDAGHYGGGYGGGYGGDYGGGGGGGDFSGGGDFAADM